MSELQAEPAAERTVAERMADAAQAMLAGLDGTQRELAGWAWSAESDAERRRWFYTPTDHGGLPVAAMTPAQYRRAMTLVSTGLSEPGYVTAATIMGLENVLDRTERFSGFHFTRERGRDPQLYYLRIFGTPGERVWAWRFGGHHISLNNLIVDGQLVSSTPCFLGADPARSPLLGGDTLRPLGGTEELGRTLARSLTESQRVRAVLTPRAPVDLVSANRTRTTPGDRVQPLGTLFRGRFVDPADHQRMDEVHQGNLRQQHITEADNQAVELTEAPSGVPAADLDTDQRNLLLALLDCYTGRVPEELARRESAKYAGPALDQVHFAWAGSSAPAAPCYYRLQGPRLLVEYDNTQRQANHAHSVWRDPEGDFGADLLAVHHRAHH